MKTFKMTTSLKQTSKLNSKRIVILKSMDNLIFLRKGDSRVPDSHDFSNIIREMLDYLKIEKNKFHLESIRDQINEILGETNDTI